jgi:hypothetical protein
MKKSIALIFSASTLFLAGCCSMHHGHATTKWEYKVVRNERDSANLGDPRLDPKLTELGSQGWELVSWNSDSWVFKRPIK